MFKVLMAIFGLSLLTPVNPAFAEDDLYSEVEEKKAVSTLIEEYVKNQNPSPQDLEKLQTDPLARKHGPAIICHIIGLSMSEPEVLWPKIFESDKPLTTSDIIDIDSKLFNLLEQLNPSDVSLAVGLSVMVFAFEQARDPAQYSAKALEYYNRIKSLPETDGVNYYRADAVFSLVRLYCRQNDIPAAINIYQDFSNLTGPPGVAHNQWMAKGALTTALAQNGQITEARKYYDEMDAVPPTLSFELWGSFRADAGKALADAYKKVGDVKAAEELDRKAAIDEEKLNKEWGRIADVLK